MAYLSFSWLLSPDFWLLDLFARVLSRFAVVGAFHSASSFPVEMKKYIYDIDDNPPFKYAILYGLQWTVIVFPSLIIISVLSSKALHMTAGDEVRFLQLILLVSGAFTAFQNLWGHRYPLIEGPSTAVLLTFLVLAPFGIQTIQGGTILGGALVITLVLIGRLKKVVAYATPNVIGVILMLIAFSLLPFLIKSMTGVDDAHPGGEASVLLFSLTLVVVMAALSHWLRGFWKTISLLMGMLGGTLLFSFLIPPDIHKLSSAGWLSLPSLWASVHPGFYWPAVVAFACSYVAVVVNSLGSLHGVANITDPLRLPSAIKRGILINGVAGICCGLLGIVGTVSYSMSPGVILANRVSSRYALVYCGGILIVAAFVPKLVALLDLVPGPVVGAALCVAMGVQVGAGLALVAGEGFSGRDYLVVGLPLLIGTFAGFIPESLMATMPAYLRVFLGNGLIVGIFLVLVLEHLILRKEKAA
jgi:xanthine/uracil permease